MRTALVPVAPGPLHYSGKPLCGLATGHMTPDAAAALLAVHTALGGALRVTEAFRSVADQAAARARYDADHSRAFTALPGRSWHAAGRAIDVDLDGTLAAMLSAPQSSQGERWVTLRGALRRCGWRPITDDARGPGVSEAWHHEYRGPWGRLCDDSRSAPGYEAAALGATLDVASDSARAALARYVDRLDEREVQAQLARAGFDVGTIDGVLGVKTWAAVERAGLGTAGQAVDVVLRGVRALPDRRAA